MEIIYANPPNQLSPIVRTVAPKVILFNYLCVLQPPGLLRTRRIVVVVESLSFPTRQGNESSVGTSNFNNINFTNDGMDASGNYKSN
jgi:hypothetical protein